MTGAAEIMVITKHKRDFNWSLYQKLDGSLFCMFQ
jgi:hypothetical protein